MSVRAIASFVVTSSLLAGTGDAQPPVPTPPPTAAVQPTTPAGTAAPLTLQGVLTAARANSQQVLAALNAAELASEDRKQARSALLSSILDATIMGPSMVSRLDAQPMKFRSCPPAPFRVHPALRRRMT